MDRGHRVNLEHSFHSTGQEGGKLPAAGSRTKAKETRQNELFTHEITQVTKLKGGLGVSEAGSSAWLNRVQGPSLTTKATAGKLTCGVVKMPLGAQQAEGRKTIKGGNDQVLLQQQAQLKQEKQNMQTEKKKEQQKRKNSGDRSDRVAKARKDLSQSNSIFLEMVSSLRAAREGRGGGGGGGGGGEVGGVGFGGGSGAGTVKRRDEANTVDVMKEAFQQSVLPPMIKPEEPLDTQQQV